MDNRIFDINGRGKRMLTDVLRLALWHQAGCYEDEDERKAVGYRVSKTSGLILVWTIRPELGDNKFIAPLGPEALAEMIMEWLKTDEAKKTDPKDSWDTDCDHDGHNSEGWRVSCGSWGHVDEQWGAIVGIRPVFLWHGK